MTNTVPRDYREMEWTGERVARFWEYEAQFPEKYFTYYNGETMVTLLEPYYKEAEQILDFACGTGNLMEHLINQGHKVAGIESSELAVATVRARFKNSPLFLGAFEPAEFQRNSKTYGAIFACEILEHLSDPDLENVVSQLRKLANKDTNLIITTPNAENLADSHIYCPACDHVFHRWQHVRSWNSDTLKDFLGKHGLLATKVFATNFSLTRRERENSYRTWKALRKKRKKMRKAKTKGPHLVAIAKPT